MHFATSVVALAASASVVSAATVTFWTLDDITRTVYFTGNPGNAAVDPVTATHSKNVTATLPDTWVGNFYAVQEGAENKPGMLGELSLGSFLGTSFFDVSGIVDPADHNNVKQIWPVEAKEPTSGCEVFPCNNAYWLPDDKQTKSTQETEFMVTLGGSGAPAKQSVQEAVQKPAPEAASKPAASKPAAQSSAPKPAAAPQAATQSASQDSQAVSDSGSGFVTEEPVDGGN